MNVFIIINNKVNHIFLFLVIILAIVFIPMIVGPYLISLIPTALPPEIMANIFMIGWILFVLFGLCAPAMRYLINQEDLLT